MTNSNRTKNTARPSQRNNQPPQPKLNGKHRVTIRFGAMENSIEVDGHKVDLTRRPGEDNRDIRNRLERTVHDLNQMIFA